MPVSSKHPQYQQYFFVWKKCRDCVEGEEAVKGAGQIYLPQLEAQRNDEYEGYKSRALFYGASDRTVKALTGAVMRRPPQVKFPDAKSSRHPERKLLDDVGSRDEPFELIVKKVVEEVVTTGRVGVYVDSDSEGDAGADPYICLYFTENIINWGERVVKGRRMLEFVVLLEDSPTRSVEESQDGFEYRRKERWRVLLLEGIETPNPRLRVTVYERKDQNDDDEDQNVETTEGDGDDTDEDKNGYQVVFDAYPTFWGGRPIPFIPFKFINPSNNTTEIEKPPILSLVNVNLSHYRNSADYEHGLHFTALPTAWVAGFDPNTTRLRIGSSIAWVSENVQAKAGFLEFSGHGLGSIASAMDKKEKQMAVLGARLLEEQKADSEAAAALRLRHSGEESVLQHIVKSIDEGLEDVLKWVAMWISQTGSDISVKLNDEFNPLGIDPQTMIVLMNGVQAGNVSWDTLYYNYKRGNIYPDGWTPEQEKTAIEAGQPMPPPAVLADDTELRGVGGGVKSVGRMGPGGSLTAGEGADDGGVP